MLMIATTGKPLAFERDVLHADYAAETDVSIHLAVA